MSVDMDTYPSPPQSKLAPSRRIWPQVMRYIVFSAQISIVFGSVTLSGCLDSISPPLILDYGAIREEVCGDRVLSRYEQCDDGNQIDGDGCSSSCLVEATPQGGETAGTADINMDLAGDELAGTSPAGILMTGGSSVESTQGGEDTDPLGGEEEAGAQLAGDENGGAPADESGLLCGDGVIGLGEQCDDGNQDAGDGCSSACQLEISACQDDQFEPNQDIVTASMLMAGDQPNSIEAMLCRADVDVFQVAGCLGGQLEVTLDFDVFSADLDIRLIDDTGRLLATSAEALATERINETLVSDTPVFIEVYGYLDEQEGSYVLGVSLRDCGFAREDCSRLGDEDGNGLADCDDPACFGPQCDEPPPLREDCTRLGDEDGNGLADCDDPACFGPLCDDPPPLRENCAQLGDEDGNGLIDCNDPACFNDPACINETEPNACAPQALIPAAGFGVYSGNTIFAPAEERGSCAGNGNEHVYRFIAPQTGAVCVDSGGSNYDTALHVRSECANADAELACNDDSIFGLQSQLSFNATAGQSYYIFMDGFGGSGDYTLSISRGACGQEPPLLFEDCLLFGDEDGNGLADCDDPACFTDPTCALPSGPAACAPSALFTAPSFGSYGGSTLFAPAEERGSCAGSGNEHVYRFIAPQTGAVCVDSSGSSYDTALHVRSECANPNAELACNDDSIFGLQSQLSFNATAGQSYYIFMDGFGGSGDYTLSISAGACGQAPPPLFEDCALLGDEDGNGLADCDDPACFAEPACLAPPGPSACAPSALLVASGFGVYSGDTFSAPSEERGSCAGNGNEHVYMFVSPQSGIVCVDSDGSSYDTALHVRSSCADANSEIACNDDALPGLQSQLSFNATAGQLYYIFMDGFGGSGAYTLSISAGGCSN